VKFNEIIIIDDTNGQPHVRLTGDFSIAAQEKKIDEILISLSYNNEYAIAYATAQSIDRM
ncbi:MAG: holo-[acyl-carrier-protein] synthase, partial [Mobilitalea sp.]